MNFDDTNKYRTFKHWSSFGFIIKAGSKAVGRNSQGECVFSRDQVEHIFDIKRKRPKRRTWTSGSADYDTGDADLEAFVRDQYQYGADW